MTSPTESQAEPIVASADVQAALAAIQALLSQRPRIQNAAELQVAERAIVAATDSLASAILAQQLQAAVDEPELQAQALAFIKSAPKKLKNQGRRDVTIQGTRGPAFTIRTGYHSPNQPVTRKKTKK